MADYLVRVAVDRLEAREAEKILNGVPLAPGLIAYGRMKLLRIEPNLHALVSSSGRRTSGTCSDGAEAEFLGLIEAPSHRQAVYEALLDLETVGTETSRWRAEAGPPERIV